MADGGPQEGSSPTSHLCQFCEQIRDRVCCGPTPEVAICLDCAELAVEVLRA